VMFDWCLTIILARDVVNPKIDQHAAIAHALYEPGHIIVPPDETRSYHYIVEAGQ